MEAFCEQGDGKAETKQQGKGGDGEDVCFPVNFFLAHFSRVSKNLFDGGVTYRMCTK